MKVSLSHLYKATVVSITFAVHLACLLMLVFSVAAAQLPLSASVYLLVLVLGVAMGWGQLIFMMLPKMETKASRGAIKQLRDPGNLDKLASKGLGISIEGKRRYTGR